MNQRKTHRILGRTRRHFLQFSAATLSTLALSNCARSAIEQSDPTEQSSGSNTPASASDNKKLYFYTWADYINDEVFQRFTNKTGIEIIADTYDSNETMLAKLQAGGGTQYSVIYPSDYMVQQMVEMNLLTKLDTTRLTGMNHLMSRWESPTYDPNNAHSIPYNWGTTGLIYNTRVIDTAPEDWNFLWENADALKGKMTLLDDVRETMGAVLKSLGYSYNATDPTQIEAAYQKLLELKPAIAAFKTYGWEDQLISGDLAIAMTYSVLGNLLPEDNPHLKYVIPQSGSSIWTDVIAIPATAPNPEAAYAWMNFIMEPENAAFAAEKMKLGTPNKTAFEALPANLKSNTNLYPDAALIDKCEGIAPVGKAIELYDKYWTQLKSA